MKKILMVTMSDHTSFQDGVFSMYENLKDRYKVTTLTIKNSDYPAPRNSDNLFIDAPKRPGIRHIQCGAYSSNDEDDSKYGF